MCYSGNSEQNTCLSQNNDKILEPLQHLLKGSANHRFILNAVLMVPHCTQKWEFEEVTSKTNTLTIKQFDILLEFADTLRANCVINHNALNCLLLAIINALTFAKCPTERF